MSKSSRDSSTSCQTLQRDKNTDLSIFSSFCLLSSRQLYLRLSYFPKVVNNFKFSFSFNPPCKDRAHEGKARERLFHSPRIVNYRSNSPSISETWARAIDSSPSPRLLPIVSRGAHIAIPVIIHRWLTVPRGHNRECLSGAASAVAALIYLPPPFPILSVRATLTSTTRWYFTVTTDASEPVVVPGIRLPTDTGYRELRTMQGPLPTPLRRFFFWPSSAPVTTFVGSRLIGLLDDERLRCCRGGNTGRSSSVYERVFRYDIADGIVI